MCTRRGGCSRGPGLGCLTHQRPLPKSQAAHVPEDEPHGRSRRLSVANSRTRQGSPLASQSRRPRAWRLVTRWGRRQVGKDGESRGRTRASASAGVGGPAFPVRGCVSGTQYPWGDDEGTSGEQSASRRKRSPGGEPGCSPRGSGRGLRPECCCTRCSDPACDGSAQPKG